MQWLETTSNCAYRLSLTITFFGEIADYWSYKAGIPSKAITECLLFENFI